MKSESRRKRRESVTAGIQVSSDSSQSSSYAGAARDPSAPKLVHPSFLDDARVEGRRPSREYVKGRKEKKGNALSINFSVDVNMYSEKVTSYWYRLRCNQRSSDDGWSMIATRRPAAATRRTTVDTDAESNMPNGSLSSNAGGLGEGGVALTFRLRRLRFAGLLGGWFERGGLRCERVILLL